MHLRSNFLELLQQWQKRTLFVIVAVIVTVAATENEAMSRWSDSDQLRLEWLRMG